MFSTIIVHDMILEIIIFMWERVQMLNCHQGHCLIAILFVKINLGTVIWSLIRCIQGFDYNNRVENYEYVNENQEEVMLKDNDNNDVIVHHSLEINNQLPNLNA